MKLWMSGEVSGDVGDAFQRLLVSVEPAVNELLAGSDYGGDIVEWAHIPMIMDGNPLSLNEIAKYRKKKREVEFRLVIPHDQFRDTSDVHRWNLLIDSLVRAIGMMEGMGVSGLDTVRLQSDVGALRQH